MDDRLGSSAPRRIAVIHNTDYLDRRPAEELVDDDEEPPSFEADAEVAETAVAVAEALVARGEDVLRLGVADRTEAVLPALVAHGVTHVFNLVESLRGEAAGEAEFARILDAAGVPYTGNGPHALWLAHAKDLARHLLAAHQIPIAAGFAVRSPRDVPDPVERGLTYPLIVKPARVDGSIGIDQRSVVWDRAQLDARVRHLLAWLGPCMVEEYLPGAELNVAILPDPHRGLLVPTTVDFSGVIGDGLPLVTYAAKWCPESPEYASRSRPPGADVPAVQVDEALRVARAAFLALGCTSYGRVDLRIDRDGRPRVIDVNPNPDLHPDAGLAIAARSAGVDYPSLVAALAAGATVKRRYVLASHPARRPGPAGFAAEAC